MVDDVRAKVGVGVTVALYVQNCNSEVVTCNVKVIIIVYSTGKLVPDIWIDCAEDFQLSRQLICSSLTEDWSFVCTTRVLLHLVVMIVMNTSMT